MAQRIYTRSLTGDLEPLEEEPFPTEDELQELIAKHPELLDGEQIRPDEPRRWILVTREKSISDSPAASARWALDHLMVDQDARPTLVEVKRGNNPEIRRTVVGQLLEYAANASVTWKAEELRDSFEATSKSRGLEPDRDYCRAKTSAMSALEATCYRRMALSSVNNRMDADQGLHVRSEQGLGPPGASSIRAPTVGRSIHCR